MSINAHIEKLFSNQTYFVAKERGKKEKSYEKA
jgi:hypothetical protein